MANHYILQDLERQLILKGLSKEELTAYINIAIVEKLDREEGK
jgi:hypothetical protein